MTDNDVTVLRGKLSNKQVCVCIFIPGFAKVIQYNLSYIQLKVATRPGG